MTNDANSAATAIRLGRIELFPTERQLLIDDKPAHVGARAFDLLRALLAHPGEVVGKQKLLETVWPDVIVEENNLQVQVSTLRRLLGPEAIVTVPGRGYLLAPHHEWRTPAALPREAFNRQLDAGLAPLRGREGVLPQLERQVSAHRLVCVAGPAGVGKTRLVQELVPRVAAQFRDGVVTIELGPLRRGMPCAGQFARSLRGLDTRARASPFDVAQLVAGKSMLLVVENCEHVLEGVGSLARLLLAQAPDVHLLLTSQIALGMTGEHLLRLAPLGLPAMGQASSARASAAVQLLEDTILALQGDGGLADSDLKDAAAICRHLDGLPLALQMAGTRVPMLGVSGVRRQLGRRFDLLTSGSRNAPARHHSLSSAFDWTWQLLDEEERAALTALCRFTGYFSLHMAQDVLAASGMPQGVMALVSRLIDKSVVSVQRMGGRTQMHILETMRMFVTRRPQA